MDGRRSGHVVINDWPVTTDAGAALTFEQSSKDPGVGKVEWWACLSLWSLRDVRADAIAAADAMANALVAARRGK